MKITCTQAEKDWLVECLMTSEPICIFADDEFTGCGSCTECLDKQIEWEIEDGEDDHGYEQQSKYRDYCENFEPTYNPEDGSL